MTDRIERLLKRVEEFHPGTAAELEEFRIKVLGRKGEPQRTDGRIQNRRPGTETRTGPAPQRTQEPRTGTHQRTEKRTRSACSRDSLGHTGRHDAPRHRAAARQPAPHIAGKERDMRYIRTARLCHSRRPGDRGRLARILGPELPAGTSGTRHAGYVLHRKRPRHPAPYPHQPPFRYAPWRRRNRLSG